MLTKKKFGQLKSITQLKKIADELQILRDVLLSGDEEPDLSRLAAYSSYCTDLQLYPDVAVTLKGILEEKIRRLLLEKIHFLFHELMERIGYPVSEKQFVQQRGDRKPAAGDLARSELVIVLDNLRSAFNVGSIIRLGECLGIKKILAGGHTPTNMHPKVIKTAKGCQESVAFEKCDDIGLSLAELAAEGYQIVAVETTTASSSMEYFPFKEKTALIFGNEEIGISQHVLDLAEKAVAIEMKGYKNSLNVANAASIAVYEYNRQNFSCCK